jgi:hypothetical protein
LKTRLAGVLLALCCGACSLLNRPASEPGAPPPAPDPLPVKKVQEEIIVAAWAEPSRLPHGGGQAQILVRVQRRGGARFPGVEVRLATSTGSLYSKGRILVTDAQGLTRDRLTAREAATITLNAGGTRYTFQVYADDAALK